ncbi:hypothetical protein LCGC14_0964820 [marine sediment metagenome]|uniref:Uncharacterized protein n=1 Tax=marine sediment metagenome TaxID=412755 RepID=A0A0F9NZJ4_9ZZZZ
MEIKTIALAIELVALVTQIVFFVKAWRSGDWGHYLPHILVAMVVVLVSGAVVLMT